MYVYRPAPLIWLVVGSNLTSQPNQIKEIEMHFKKTCMVKLSATTVCICKKCLFVGKFNQNINMKGNREILAVFFFYFYVDYRLSEKIGHFDFFSVHSHWPSVQIGRF